MISRIPTGIERLDERRRALGMTHVEVAARSGVSVPTVKRVLGGRVREASLGNVWAIATALGVTLEVGGPDAEEFRRAAARAKAERVARLVQGTSALESQAVDAAAYSRLVERTYHELMAGSGRKLWKE